MLVILNENRRMENVRVHICEKERNKSICICFRCGGCLTRKGNGVNGAVSGSIRRIPHPVPIRRQTDTLELRRQQQQKTLSRLAKSKARGSAAILIPYIPRYIDLHPNLESEWETLNNIRHPCPASRLSSLTEDRQKSLRMDKKKRTLSYNIICISWNKRDSS